MTIEQRKKEQDLIVKLINVKEIFVTMYGLSKTEDDIIRLFTHEIHKFVYDWAGKGPGFVHFFGWPGPDGAIYLLSDYGETWAFTEEELKVK